MGYAKIITPKEDLIEMNDLAPNHYSHSYQLSLEKLPTKKSDRIAMHILYPGLIFGAILIFLGIYELLNGLSHSRTDFDALLENGGETIYQPFMSPTFFDIVIIFVGLGIVLSLFFSYIRYKKIFFDGQNVQIIYRPIFGAKKVYKEPLKNYEGVRFRIEFFQFGFLTKNKYIIELHHKNPVKTAPLYISTKDKNIRKIWEYYSKKLNKPAIVMTDEGIVSRKVEDLDKPLKQLVDEGININQYDDREPLPPTIAVVRKRDKTVIKARKIFWDAYNIIAWMCLILFGGLLLFASFNYETIRTRFTTEFIMAVYVVGIFIIAISIFALFRKDKIIIKRDKIVIVHKFMLFSRKNNEIKKAMIEAVNVTVNPCTGRYFLAIVSDDRTAIFGKKIPIEDLRWVKKFLINEVVRSK